MPTSLPYCLKIAPFLLTIPGVVAQSLHGTINVVLANENALVIETDSRLSNDGKILGNGQKLFRIDDRTVCAIAGFYSDPGPTFGTDGQPVFTSIPNIVQTYLDHSPHISRLSIEEKLSKLADLAVWSLELVNNLDRAAARQPNPSILQLTMAGFDNDQKKIARVDLTPSVTNNVVDYRVSAQRVTIVKRDLVWSLAGIANVAEKVLTQPESFTAEPFVLRYLESMSKDKGRSLSKLDLEGLAEYLKFLTSFSYPTEVGGKSQHAVLADGRITFFEQPIPNRPSPRRSPFFLHDDHLVFAGSTSHPGAMGIFVSRGRGELITNSKLSYIRQPLDNIVFVETTFDHCTLTYDGSPVTLFDSTNVVIDSTLVLGPQVDEFDPIVSRIKVAFPNLPISHSQTVIPKP